MSVMKDIRLWGILILALGLRTVLLMAVFADVRRAMTPDSWDYVNVASNLATYGEYGRIAVNRKFYNLSDGNDAKLFQAILAGGPGVTPEIFRTPGYPTLLAGAGRIAPIYRDYRPGECIDFPMSYMPPGRTCMKIVLSFQVLLDLHLVMLTFLLGRALAGHGVGLLAALLQAVSPLAAAASCRILSDGLFAFMLIAAVVLLLRHFRTGGWWSLLSAALMMGAACYVRPVGLAFSAVMALVVLCSRRGTGILPVSRRAVSAMAGRHKTTGETPVGLMGETPMLPSSAEATEGKRPRGLLRTLAFVAVVVGCVAPWVARNAVVADYCGFSSFATDSMYWYSAAETEARQQHKSVEDVREQFRRAEGWYSFDPDLVGQPGLSDAPSDRTSGGLARYRWGEARRIILAHPWQYAGIHLTGDAAFWLPGATDALEVMGYTSGGKGTLDVLHRQGLLAAVRHYFGDNTAAMALALAMVGLLLIRYAGVFLCGLWRLRLRKMTAGGWLCLLLVLTACLLPGPANHPRFRVPVEPILSVAAAIGYLGLLQWRRRRRGREESGLPQRH